MSRAPDRLYELLPTVHRMRDAERGYPLRALLRVINEQADVIEDDIARLYDNWFIETCEDWAVPYIGELIGYRPVHEAGAAQLAERSAVQRLGQVMVPRRDVADTVNFRRRKGTLALLELLANSVAGWPARAVEFYALLSWTQHIDHLRLQRGRTANLQDGDALDLLCGPFDQIGHTVDIRRPGSLRRQGRYNIPVVGIFVWRLKPYSVTLAPAFRQVDIAPNCFSFSLLGNDTPLVTNDVRETEPTHIAEELNVPGPIRRRALHENPTERLGKSQASAVYYGETKSLAIYAPDWPRKGAAQPIPRDTIIVADLSDWRYRAGRNQVAVDPVLGRIVFPSSQLPKSRVRVSYHYSFSTDMGAGEYDRVLSQPARYKLYRVSKTATLNTINAALSMWRDEQKTLGDEPVDDVAKQKWKVKRERLRAAVIEIGDSDLYTEQLAITLEAGESLQIRAANRKRPTVRLLDSQHENANAGVISGKQGSRFTLDGLLIIERGLQIVGPDRENEARGSEDLCDITIRHCTLVPGWTLECDCCPTRPNEPSLELINTRAKLVIEHSIVGSIYVIADEVDRDPAEIEISDSIVDATSFSHTALGAPNLPLAFARVSIVRSTVIGSFDTHEIALAENSIFMSPIRVGRRQHGCMRFCYVTPGSRTPRRYHCQPDLVIAAVDEMNPPPSEAVKLAKRSLEQLRVRPSFNSLRYGTPAYCQLADDCAAEIKRGADDESEMGAFHDLFQPQREANLRTRLDEYTPAGMEAGIFFAN